MEGKGDIAPFLAGTLCGFMLAIMIVVNFAIKPSDVRHEERQKAIEAGVGYWRQVEDGPKTEFVYGVKPQPHRNGTANSLDP